MRIFGLEITKAKAMAPVTDRGWLRIIRESFAGAWQKNIEVEFNSVVAQHAVFACMTLIARDIAKLRVKLVKMEDGIWEEVTDPAFSPVLQKPNHYQNRIQFFEHWILSKLMRGNTYVLKVRDNRQVVIGLYVLDPTLVKPLVADNGDVYYELQADSLSRLTGETAIVPASEIIHDRMNCLFHPLVGLSPIFANGLAATQGLNIQSDAAAFFGNASTPGGILVAPGAIAPETAERLKDAWEKNYSGANAGRVAVLGDGLKFEQMRITAVDSQVVEQLKWTAEVVCSTFHVPAYKVGVGTVPNHNSVQALNLDYYGTALQSLIEDIELCLDEGLGTGAGLGTEFETDDLLRMDSLMQMEVLEKAKSVLTLDERRAKLDRKPMTTGGATVYLQQQDHSIEAIAARDRLLIEQANNPAPPALPEPDPEAPPEEVAAGLAYYLQRELAG